jgi:hypothetical protein
MGRRTGWPTQQFVYEGSRNAGSTYDDDVLEFASAYHHAQYDEEMYQ